MLLSSLYILPNFLDDRAEVVATRVKQSSGMKLLTVAQDFELHARLERMGLNDNQSFNMYDWFQGALNYKNLGVNNDARVLNRYDKRNGVLAPVNGDKESYLNFNMEGQPTAKLSYMPGFVARTKKVELKNDDQLTWAEDYYDSRGFLSRRKYFNPDGKLGVEIIYHVDGTPVIEISHMGDKEMYRLLGTHGLPNWLLQNELSLMLWWLDHMIKSGELKLHDMVYNDDPYLDAVWPQLNDKLELTEVIHGQNATKNRIAQVLAQKQEQESKNNLYHITTPSRFLSKQWDLPFKSIWIPGQTVEQNDEYSPLRIATVGVWTNDALVKKLINFVRAVLRKLPHVTIHLFGYFSVDSQKFYDKLIKQHKLQDKVVVHGNIVGEQRKIQLQACALAWWLPLETDSDVIPHLLNHYGLPVVSTQGDYGASIKKPTSELLSKGVKAVYENLSEIRKQVKEYGK